MPAFFLNSSQTVNIFEITLWQGDNQEPLWCFWSSLSRAAKKKRSEKSESDLSPNSGSKSFNKLPCQQIINLLYSCGLCTLMAHLTLENLLLKWADESSDSLESFTKAKCETNIKCCMFLTSELFSHYYQQKQLEHSRHKIICFQG